MQRRSFLQKLFYAAAMSFTASLPFGLSRMLSPAVAAKPQRQIPLPGALADSAAFNAACIGCGICAEVCPPQCILFHRNDGGITANTPYINPEEKACTLCGKCMAACPTPALTVIDRHQIDMGIAQIDRSACFPWVDRGICGACVSVCPLGDQAISFNLWNQYQPIVQSGCVGCGQCVEVCPHPSLPIRIIKRTQEATA